MIKTSSIYTYFYRTNDNYDFLNFSSISLYGSYEEDYTMIEEYKRERILENSINLVGNGINKSERRICLVYMGLFREDMHYRKEE